MHEPHCSEYGRQCFQRYGFVRSLFPVTDRVLHCT
ncbi:membrane protein insertion efficiency factor YidD [Patescibacteria group bacterium]|nr:membrane protein insertion efficiency factor YidD [Patescibacteria group bacterium]MBP7841188.1 membrane protein insertion efficiency factor YidD [Patescibacteria group bacterium]